MINNILLSDFNWDVKIPQVIVYVKSEIITPGLNLYHTFTFSKL